MAPVNPPWFLWEGVSPRHEDMSRSRPLSQHGAGGQPWAEEVGALSLAQHRPLSFSSFEVLPHSLTLQCLLLGLGPKLGQVSSSFQGFPSEGGPGCVGWSRAPP